eukprot:scaffold286579_cov21-Tisochrysis_lutea.AAC.4
MQAHLMQRTGVQMVICEHALHAMRRFCRHQCNKVYTPPTPCSSPDWFQPAQSKCLCLSQWTAAAAERSRLARMQSCTCTPSPLLHTHRLPDQNFNTCKRLRQRGECVRALDGDTFYPVHHHLISSGLRLQATSRHDNLRCELLVLLQNVVRAARREVQSKVRAQAATVDKVSAPTSASSNGSGTRPCVEHAILEGDATTVQARTCKHAHGASDCACPTPPGPPGHWAIALPRTLMQHTTALQDGSLAVWGWLLRMGDSSAPVTAWLQCLYCRQPVPTPARKPQKPCFRLKCRFQLANEWKCNDFVQLLVVELMNWELLVDLQYDLTLGLDTMTPIASIQDRIR